MSVPSSPYQYTTPISGRKWFPKEETLVSGRIQYGECVCIAAPARQGKTLTMTKIIVQRLVDEGDKIDKLICNIPLDLSPIGMEDKFVYLEDIDILREVPPKGKVRIIAVDEMRRLLDSRCSIGQKNRVISNLFSDTFKQRSDLYYRNL